MLATLARRARERRMLPLWRTCSTACSQLSCVSSASRVGSRAVWPSIGFVMGTGRRVVRAEPAGRGMGAWMLGWMQVIVMR